jgi:hypothetical protein
MKGNAEILVQELIPWEEHLITLDFPRNTARTPASNPLPGALLQILTFCAEKGGNVPPLSAGSVSYPLCLARLYADKSRKGETTCHIR